MTAPAGVASAQDPPPPPAPPPAAAPAPTAPTPAEAAAASDADSDEAIKKLMADAEKNPEVITVRETGSLIERTELISAAPITVLSRSDIESTGLVTTGDILQRLPSQGGGINNNFNNGGDGSTRIALRNLGSGRTLVLLNGRRIVAGGTGADASVDLNTIPVAVIERIEILKDGASAIYGSDAIGGVVNIITRKDYRGLEATAQVGTTQRGDGQSYDFNFVTGAGDKKANVIFSGGYSQQKPIFAGDRDYSKFDLSAAAGGFKWRPKDKDGNPLPPGFAPNPGGSSGVPGGRLGTTDADGNNLPGNALWQSEVLGHCASGLCTRDPVTNAWRDYGPADAYNYQPSNYLVTPLERYNMFSQGSYQLSDNVRAFFEGSFMNRSSAQILAPEPLLTTISPSTPISRDSIYNPYGLDITDYRRRLEEFGNRTSTQSVNSFRIVAGFDGEIPENPILHNWKWEASANYGRTDASQKNEGNLILSHLTNALGPSYRDASGAHCGTPGNPIDGCVPLDLLSGAYQHTITPDMMNYVTFNGVSGGFNEQQSVLATLHGPLLKLPNNGLISLAVGGDYRREAGGFDPDPLTATGDTTGNQIAPVSGSYHVVEGFAELQIIPIAEKEWARWLELDFAARVFDYSSFGNGVTWKAGGLFRTEGGFAVRGTYSSAFRAPSIADLFAGQADNFAPVLDPCDISQGGGDPVTLSPAVAAQCKKEGVPANFAGGLNQQREKVGGNTNLQAETANTFTAGVVWEPPFIKGLSATADYFNIKIDHAIGALGADVILNSCYSASPTECDKIHRDPDTHLIDTITDVSENLTSLETSGLDFAVAYDFSNKDLGRFHVGVVGTLLFSINELIGGIHKNGYGVYDLAGGAGANPTLKANFSVAWAKKGFSLGSNVRYISGYDECENNDCSIPDAPRRSVDSYVTADFFAGYQFATPSLGTTQVAIGMNNAFDATPPFVANGGYGNSDGPTYDFIGRFFYARLTQSF